MAWQLITTIILFASCSMLTAASVEPEFQWSESIIETEEEGAAVLIIPMEGQMHTDVNQDLYKNLTDRIKELEPDLIIIEILNYDFETEFAQLMGWRDRQEGNQYDPDDLVGIASTFRLDLKNIPQVAWVKKSSGTSTIMALAWCDIYMSPEGWLRSTRAAASRFNYIKAEDTYGKIREAVVAHSKAIATFGCKDASLLRAFVDPEVPLSGTWEGKEVKWEQSVNGDFLVDGGQGMPQFDSTMATELAISKGIIHNRNDLLIAEGIREYHIVGKDITAEIEEHKKTWRENFARASELWLDAQQYAGWAVGEQTQRYLREQLKKVKQVLRLMEDSSAVSMRMGWKHQVRKDYLENLIEEIEERLKQLREGDAGGRGRGGSGGRPIGGGGGGGR